MIITTTIYPDGRQKVKTEYTFEEFLVIQQSNPDIDYKRFELVKNALKINLN
jgi:hypothetical protein